jgi:cytochrome c oxidase cbb3-type subunit 2
MNNGPLLFLGIFATLASSFWGLVLVPQLQLGRQDQVVNAATFALYPQPRGGLAKQGAEVYRSLGCVECHSQQVRGLGADVARGWGVRKTVAQDYLGDYPVLLGSQRLGPDLANIGLRQPKRFDLLQHLYNPQSSVPGSMMPPYRFLFETRKLTQDEKPSPDALEIVSEKVRYEVVPRPEATALAEYLLSLRNDSPLYEAPVPKSASSTNAVASTNEIGTNVISTNAAATNTPPGAPPATPPK